MIYKIIYIRNAKNPTNGGEKKGGDLQRKMNSNGNEPTF
jgi:hypothetical protein